MVAQNVFFAILALLMIVSALKVVTTKNIVHAALWLVLVLAGVAGQFLLLGAEFVGVTQILVYIGAVIVLLLFGVMLTKASIGDEENINMPNRVLPAVIGTLMFAVMSYSIIDSYRGEELPKETVTNAARVSDSIFSDFIIPFEAVSVLLLAALIGAVVIARKEVNINLVAFSALTDNIAGEVFALFVIAIAAAEVGVGLAIVLLIFRNKKNVDLSEIDQMKG